MFDFFTSDLHIGHKNIIEYCKRPFSSVEEMNEQIIERYNSKVSINDKVLFCGDIFFKGNKEYYKQVLSRLNGIKTLMLGNHDQSKAKMLELGFNEVHHEIDFSIDGLKFKASHYPYFKEENIHQYSTHTNKYPKYDPDTYLIHGHTHSNKKLSNNEICVCVEAWDYYPATISEVISLVNN